ncbi:hypothetical protein EOD41_00640 [Mucilaginibacter limnophilus]|uniref:DUF748 domain-containing protein n=1 Tax=Mucilaginibacter limnophilus TaxID=1932778 RepID=A0A437MXT1_9SPHI|nr:hypothetical protein [Mucilaginibacter limnophilus]RVU02481.1 hypothetical protein EOD41_00640 [Mucilaginibacter limnophilus]
MKNKKQIVFWILGFLAFILIVFLAGRYLIKQDMAKPEKNSLIKPLIKDQFTKMITTASDSLYQVKFNRFNFDLKQGKATITAFQLIPDKNIFQKLKSEGRAPNYLLYCKADTIRITGFGFKNRNSITRFDIDSLIASRVLLTCRTKYLGKTRDDGKGVKEKLLKELSEKVLKRMYVRRLLMHNAKIVWVNNNRPVERRTNITANINISGFETSPGNNGSVIKIAKYIHSPHDLYDIVFNKIRFSTGKSSAFVQHVSVLPRAGKLRFNQLAKFDKDRYHFELDGLKMNGINIYQFIAKQQLSINSFVINKTWAEVYKDYRWPKKEIVSRINTYPNEKLQRLAIDIKIDTMRMHNGTFHHTIFPEKSKHTARFTLTDIESVYTNISNISSDVQRKPYAYVYSTCRLMGAALLTSRFTFNLAKSNAPFSVITTLSNMDSRSLNPLLKPLAMMEMKQGNINKMRFVLNGDEHSAKGHVDLYYSNLKVNVLKRDKDDGTLKNMSLISFLTNTALPNNNPGKDGKLRQGPVNRIREPKETFFGFLWYCMLDGSTSAVMGYDQDKKKPNKNILIKIGEVIAGPKDKD